MGNQHSDIITVSHLCGCETAGHEVQGSGLLNVREREFWLSNLRMEGIPESMFWEKNKMVKHSSFDQIRKDICRSFPKEEFFREGNNVVRFEILLKKFALFFPKVGYTQGLNFIAGYLLIVGFSDDEAFQILASLMLNQNLLLIGIYQDGFPLAKVYCGLFWSLLNKRMPKTAAKIKQSQVPDETWIFQWFISFFLYSFPVEFIKRFLDYVICKKECAMVTLAVGIVYCLRHRIQQMKSPDEFDLFEFFDKLKSIEYCQANIKIQDVIKYANSISKREIEESLAKCKFVDNIYWIYLLREKERRIIWEKVVDKLARERKMFRLDPKCKEYQRDMNKVRHLEQYLKKKSKLYWSKVAQSRVSSQLRTSNFTIDLEEDFSTSVTEQSSPLCMHLCKQSSVPHELSKVKNASKVKVI